MLKSVRAQALGVERKNIYRSSKLAHKDEVLAEKIKIVHQTDCIYGHRRVTRELGINPKEALWYLAIIKDQLTRQIIAAQVKKT